MKNSSVLITGGTGSIGQALIDDLLDNRNVRRLAIFSRDELKQASMKAKYSHDPRVRWFIGDIRDLPKMLVLINSIGLYSPVSTCLSAAA